ncbi:MAG: histidinol-phosphate transaminase [Candidatus Tectomicrobia bacterium]|nr:histidinol-phosphate transaminase [Candidatus Tectomicrobia bacterium]
MARLLREGIGGLEDYVPGRSIEEVKAEFGLEAVEKMASNENPLGPSPLAVEAAREALAASHLYPDGSAGSLRAALARRFGLKPGNFFVGNGADDVLQNLARAFVNQGEECVIPFPFFHPYTTVTQVMGGVPVYSPLRGCRVDLSDVRARVTERTKLLFLCNPNNPTGTVFRRAEFDPFLRDLPRSAIVVLDEAYLDFCGANDVPRSESYIQGGEALVVGVRTFSKVYGLAGLRIGYGMARPAVIRALHRTKDPFNVSRPALAAAQAALEDEAFRRQSVRVVHEGKRRLYEGLGRLGVEYVPTEANFVLIHLGPQAPRMARDLMARGIIVRPCASFGWKEHVRVTVGSPGQNEKFLAALAAVLA